MNESKISPCSSGSQLKIKEKKVCHVQKSQDTGS